LGGQNNLIAPVASHSTISGGLNNQITNSIYSTIIGGNGNTINTAVLTNDNSIIGGDTNRISAGNNGLIAGGTNNRMIGGNSSNGIICGNDNIIAGVNTTLNAVILGGRFSSIDGGNSNTITGGSTCSIGGGTGNSILGGSLNMISSSSLYAAAIGGLELRVTQLYMVAMGRYNVSSNQNSRPDIAVDGGVQQLDPGTAGFVSYDPTLAAPIAFVIGNGADNTNREDIF